MANFDTETWTVDLLRLNLDALDISQLPALSCSKANVATLQGSLSISNELTVTKTLTVTEKLSANGGLAVTGPLSVSGGAVGIGTTTVSPGVQLQVVGTAKASEFLTTLYTAGDRSSLVLSKINTWADVTDLTKTFSLSQETAVLVYYQITTYGTGDNPLHLVTRLLVDGTEQVFGRAIAGNTEYWSPSNLWIGRLAQGQHTIKVQYRTPTGATNNPSGAGDDWENRVLHVLVFGS